MTTMENLEPLSPPRSVEYTHEEEVLQELCLRMAEGLNDLGACEFSREVECERRKWLVTVRQVQD